MGATVTTKVSDQLVGQALHMLEYSSDVHLLRRQARWDSVEVWTLRSDRFPEKWEGKQIRMTMTAESHGIQFEI